MTLDQFLSFAVIVGMMGLFVWGRLRYDLVAAATLLVALAVGIVPYDDAFAGFSDEIVIIVGSALLVSAGVARSGIMEAAIQRFAPRISGVRAQLALLVVHGKRDRIIPFAEGERLRAAAGARAELLAIEGADHNDFFGVAGPRYLRDLGVRLRAWTSAAAEPGVPR